MTRWRTIYSTETGEVLHVVPGEGALERAMRPGQALAEGEWPQHYIDLKTGKPQPLKIFEPEITPNRIGNIPTGTDVSRRGETLGAATRRAFRFGTRLEETVTVELRHPHYRRMTVTVPCLPTTTGTPIAQDYAELRRRAYPPLTDFADAVVKDDQAAIEAYKAACLAVKAKYPTPADA